MEHKQHNGEIKVDAEELLEIKTLLEKNNLTIINQLNDIQKQIDTLNKINVVVTNGTTKTYTMGIQDSVQNLYNEIYELKHNCDNCSYRKTMQNELVKLNTDVINIKKNMPEKFGMWLSRFTTTSSKLIKFIQIVFILLSLMVFVVMFLHKLGLIQ